MENINNQKPCVVQTAQGFSISYNNHFLYSKYNPSKTILQTIQNLQLLPGTIILCNSPALPYGLEELYSKLPQSCIMVICEADVELYNFELESLRKTLINHSDKVTFASISELNDLPLYLYKLSQRGEYKRVIRVDFSAAVSFHGEYYNQLYAACQNSVATWWKNRLTLTKFGRKYSENFFSNLALLPQTSPLSSFIHKIKKPILVCGAGQSLNQLLNDKNINFSQFYILCADTALQPLLQHGISPDGVFVEEAQAIISKAFIGAFNNIRVFAGLSSTRLLGHFIKAENLTFFTTQYTEASFLSKLISTGLLPPSNKPFGSVGLTAVYYALQFRQNENLPVFLTGLEFSYSSGITHANGSMAHTGRLSSSYRLSPVQNYTASYNSTAIKFLDKGGKLFFSTPTLKSYADLFNNLFTGIKNLYDIGNCGIPLAIPHKDLSFLYSDFNSTTTDNLSLSAFDKEKSVKINNYLASEKEALLKLRDLLTGKIKLSEEARKIEIIKIAAGREYLFLHFPDGYRFEYNQSMLNRIRTEIDFFLKFI